MSGVTASDYETIRFEVSEAVATITLHRPEVRNAFGGGMGLELSLIHI